MAGAVGSSSMAGMAASVHNILRVRASKGYWMITQHDERQKRNAEKSESEIGDGKIFYKEKSDQTQRRKGKGHTVCLLNALRVSPLRCVQTDCFAEPVSFSHDDYSGQGLCCCVVDDESNGGSSEFCARSLHSLVFPLGHYQSSGSRGDGIFYVRMMCRRINNVLESSHNHLIYIRWCSTEFATMNRLLILQFLDSVQIE